MAQATVMARGRALVAMRAYRPLYCVLWVTEAVKSDGPGNGERAVELPP